MAKFQKGQIPWFKKEPYCKEKHPSFGKHRTDEAKQRLREKYAADGNPNWKGNDVGYAAIHEWVTSRKPKPELCECCKKNRPYDLANISGQYKRELDDWAMAL